MNESPYEPPTPAPEAAPPPLEPAVQLPRSTQIFQQIRDAVAQVFIGQDEVIHQVLAALLAGGHVLLEGKPGLGKTHLVLALSRTFGGSFRRIQFTPDLMPTDVTGHTLYDLASQSFRVRRGPVFAQFCSQMKSIALQPKRSPRCSKSCRRRRSPSTARRTCSRRRS